MEENEKAKLRAEFLEKKKLRCEAEAMTAEQIIAQATEMFQSDSSKEFFRRIAEKK